MIILMRAGIQMQSLGRGPKQIRNTPGQRIIPDSVACVIFVFL